MTVYLRAHTIPRKHLPGSDKWTICNLTDVTVLVGKNGSGKSLLLRSWRDLSEDTVHYVLPERTGEMSFRYDYLGEELKGGPGRRGYSSRNFNANYRERILTRIQNYFMVRGNARHNGPALGHPEDIEKLLAILLPEFEVKLRVAEVPYELKRTESNTVITSVDALSSGEAQLLSLGIDVLIVAAIWEIEQKEERVMLIDEPDTHIHPDLQGRFADFLFAAMERFKLQVVVATHSTSLLSALGQFGREKTSVAYVHTTQAELRAQKFDDVMREVASCLGGHVLMGPLFGAPLLLIEGDDDYRIWSQVPRHHVVNLAAIACNGDEIKKYQRKMEMILASLCDKRDKPLGYALLDGDKPVPTPHPDNLQNYVRFIGLHCHEAENLYLTAEVLRLMELTWEGAARKIEASHAQIGEHAETARQALNWDRRTIDLKDFMRRLVEVIDPKNVPWTTRVAAAIARAAPSGELADFLGPDVMKALWP